MKQGNKVKCVCNKGNHEAQRLELNKVYTIASTFVSFNQKFVTVDEVEGTFFDNRFEIVGGINEFTEAVKLLESQGYIVSKPKPDPQPGQIWINRVTSTKFLILKIHGVGITLVELGETSPAFSNFTTFKDFNDPVSGPGLDKL